MWAIDLPTLIIILLAGLNVGIIGFIGFDVAKWVFGSYLQYAFMIVGISALWQMTRQRF